MTMQKPSLGGPRETKKISLIASILPPIPPNGKRKFLSVVLHVRSNRLTDSIVCLKQLGIQGEDALLTAIRTIQNGGAL